MLFSVLNEFRFDRDSCNSKRYSHADFATGLSRSRLPTESCFARISPVYSCTFSQAKSSLSTTEVLPTQISQWVQVGPAESCFAEISLV